MPSRSARPVATTLLAAGLVAALSACSTPFVLHQRSGTVRDRDALELAWSTPASEPEWVPADARDIRYVASTAGPADETPAAVRIDSSAGPPASCTPLRGRSTPLIRASWAPRSTPDGVQRCGNWAVERVDGGWYGWTPVERPPTG